LTGVTVNSDDLVLCSGTLPRSSTFEERLSAARAGRFRYISVWGRDYAQAQSAGLSDADMRAMLADSGLSVAEVDPVWSWPPGAGDVRVPRELDDMSIFCFGENEMFAIADALGARSLNAVDAIGGKWTIDQATEAFANLCVRAAEHGLLVQVEFTPLSKISDLTTAWQIVRDADQPNGGLTIDSWHYFRSGSDDGLLEMIPGSRIFGIQLCDAPRRAESDLLHATLHERLLPGDGELGLESLVETFRRIDSLAPIGVEVFSDALHGRPADEIGHKAGDSVRSVLSGH
jgi:sugar phosphate isomerase/epimerase